MELVARFHWPMSLQKIGLIDISVWCNRFVTRGRLEAGVC